jgi:hypothetical protein
MQRDRPLIRILQRARRIGLPPTRLALEAGLARSACANPNRDIRSSSEAALKRVLETKEKDLLEYLIGLHGVPQKFSPDKAPSRDE